MSEKYEFDARRYCQHNMERMGKMPNGQLVGLLMVCEIDSRDVKIEALKSELVALKAAARPVVEWWDGLRRNSKWNGVKVTPEMVAMPSYWDGQPPVTVAQLDELARLVGEE